MLAGGWGRGGLHVARASCRPPLWMGKPRGAAYMAGCCLHVPTSFILGGHGGRKGAVSDPSDTEGTGSQRGPHSKHRQSARFGGQEGAYAVWAAGYTVRSRVGDTGGVGASAGEGGLLFRVWVYVVPPARCVQRWVTGNRWGGEVLGRRVHPIFAPSRAAPSSSLFATRVGAVGDTSRDFSGSQGWW